MKVYLKRVQVDQRIQHSNAFVACGNCFVVLGDHRRDHDWLEYIPKKKGKGLTLSLPEQFECSIAPEQNRLV
jgi:hypothetical protein